MKLYIFAVLALLVIFVETKHTFLGTNVNRPLVFHKNISYSSKMFQKRIENEYFTLQAGPGRYGVTIQGILAYDMTNSDATANVTQGGIGFNFVNLRMKSDRGSPLKYDLYIYA